jgi:HAD superfamily hydrolase (TIGR01509 family)
MEASRQKLHEALDNQGFQTEKKTFLEAYMRAHEKYRKIRYEQHKEVTNAVWVSEALSNIGINAPPNDSRIKAALNIFFKDFIDGLELRMGARRLILRALKIGKVGLISNFTYAPVIYNSLKKVRINEFFNSIIVSDEIGFRKPSLEIFQTALKRLQVQPEEAIYVGDSPNEDIWGANQAGLKTIFVTSQFNSLNDLHKSNQKPDYIATDLPNISKYLTELEQKIEETTESHTKGNKIN